MLTQEKLNSNWQVTSNLYKTGQNERKIQDRELQLAGLNCGCFDIGKATDTDIPVSKNKIVTTV